MTTPKNFRIDHEEQPTAELTELRRWKIEVTEVLIETRKAWEHAGRPGDLGQPIGWAMADEIDKLRTQLEGLRP